MTRSCPEQLILDNITEDMADERLALLNPRRHPGRDMDYMIVFIHRTGIRAHNGNRDNVLFPAGRQGIDEVWRFPGSRDSDEDVSGASLRLNLSGEQPIESIIVTDGRDDGRIRGKGQCSQPRAVE